jgi:uncharacterized protein (DUF983 family)
MMALAVPRTRLGAILALRCPRCREGRVFASTWRMHVRCPSCALLFLRGTGYFTGAMYFSYALGIPIIAMLTLAVYLVQPSWRLWQDVLAAWVLFLPLVPAVFRYSRVLWIHFDQYFDPAPEGDAERPPFEAPE